MLQLTPVRQYGVALTETLINELALLRKAPARGFFAVQVITSVTLAVWISAQLGMEFAWWAAISSFAVARPGLRENLRRAAERVGGTIGGAILGIVYTQLFEPHEVFVPVLLCSLLGAQTVYGTKKAAASYAWVLSSVTTMMVIFAAQNGLTGDALHHFALDRVLEVAIGVSCSVVSGLLFQRLVKPAEADVAKIAVVQDKPVRGKRLLLSVEAGLAIAVVMLVLAQANVSDLSQAMITILALLMLPANTDVEHTQQQVIDRMAQRLLGCLLAVVIGLCLYPLAREAAFLSWLTLAAGLWLGSHLQQGHARVSYLGRQFTIAWIMIFVQHETWFAEPHVALLRFSGMAVGVVTLAAVMAIAGRVWRPGV